MMDVKAPLKKLMMDEDKDTAIYFLDSKVYDKRLKGPVGDHTTKANKV